MNEFTKGEWVAEDKCGWVDVKCNGRHICSTYGLCFANGGKEVTCEDTKSNAHLIATAGTTATELAEAGYDAQKVLEVLPLIATSMGQGELEAAFELLEQCRGE